MPLQKPQLDDVSLKILDILQKQADISNAELAEQVGLSVSPCWRRVSEMREKGVIRGAVMLVDPESLGLEVNVFVHITLKHQDEKSLAEFTHTVSNRPEVMECYLMTGEADFLLRVVVENLKKYQVFIQECLTRIDCVASIRSSFALSQVKYTTALPTQHLLR